MSTEEMQRCDNCLKEYPQSKMATHFGYCRRNIKKCPTCHQMYDINFQEEHDQEYHKMEDCPHCRKSFPSAEFKSHQSTCDKKPKYCQYCDLNVPVQTYPAHVKECESRTKPCTKCDRPITNKDYILHIVSCQGIKEEPKPPARNYQEHVQQQRRQFGQPERVVAENKSRDKVKIPSYEYKKEEYKPREEYKSREEYKAREERHYAPIVDHRNEPRVISYQPPRQEVRQQPKRENIKYPSTRQQPKKEQPKKYITSVNPPSGKVVKREEVRVSGGISRNVQNSQNQPISLEQYNRRNGVGSRGEVKRTNITNPVSNKDIFPSKNGQRPSYGVNEVKSIEKKSEPVKREERPAYNGISVPSNNRGVTKAPEVKTRVIYESSSQQQPQSKPDFLHEEFAMGALDMGDDPELQMAIMQSMKGSAGTKANSQYSFEGMDVNESFVAQQKAIEEQFKKNRRY